MGKKDLYKRGKSTPSICREVEAKGIFDKAEYAGHDGCQPGSWAEVRKGDLEASLRRERRPTAEGYNGSLEHPTRITYLSISKHLRISKHGKTHRYYGLYDPEQMIHPARHRFEKDAERSPTLKTFLGNILEYFN